MECMSKLKTLACPPPLKPAAEKGLLTPEELEAAIPAVLDLGRAHFTSQCLYTVVALGVPDVIGTRTLSIAEIVSSLACPVNEDLLLRQLRVVAAAGALVESAGEQGEFMCSLTPVGKLLQTGAPQPSMAGGIKHWMEPPMWSAWSKLPEATFAGSDIPFREANGCMVFDYYKANPISAKPFNEFMTFLSEYEAAGVVEGYDWTPFKGRTVCDIGGNYGATMVALKAKYPEIRTLSFDLPEVIDAIPEAPEGVEFVKGNFFDHTTIPSCDVAFMKHILHDWSDEDCSKILQSLHLALPAHAKLVIADAIIPGIGPDNSFTLAIKQNNCLMGVIGGKERTLAEWETLFSTNGWSMEGVIHKTAGGPLCSLITVAKT